LSVGIAGCRMHFSKPAGTMFYGELPVAQSPSL